jgi:hypothetical protein
MSAFQSDSSVKIVSDNSAINSRKGTVIGRIEIFSTVFYVVLLKEPIIVDGFKQKAVVVEETQLEKV